jgi:hypothetical protein
MAWFPCRGGYVPAVYGALWCVGQVVEGPWMSICVSLDTSSMFSFPQSISTSAPQTFRPVASASVSAPRVNVRGNK